MAQTISFKQDVALAETLVAILSREQNNLVNANIDAIEAIIEEKSVVMQQMTHALQERYKLLGENRYEPNDAGLMQWLGAQNDVSIKQEWLGFQKLLTKAKELNRVNGILINKHFNRNQQQLNVLKSGNSSGEFYGPNGQSSSQSFFEGQFAGIANIWINK
jgi:flagella synthesis protein FlgN